MGLAWVGSIRGGDYINMRYPNGMNRSGAILWDEGLLIYAVFPLEHSTVDSDGKSSTTYQNQ